MKKSRFITVLFLALVFSLCTASISFASDSDTFTMTRSGDTSIDVSWSVDTQGYTVIGWYIKDLDGNILWRTDNPNATSATISGLKKGCVKAVALYYTYEKKYEESRYEYSNNVKYIHINTTPANIPKSDFSLSSVYYNSKSVNFAAIAPDEADGVQLYLYNYKTGKLVKKMTFSIWSDYYTYSFNNVYRFKVRSYYKNSDNGKTYYGAWSSYKYFDSPTFSVKNKTKKNGCTVSLKGASKVKKYKIYVSTKEDSLGKYTKAVSPKIGKTTKYTVNKIGKNKMKKGKTYYVNIVPIIKTGDSSTTKSETYVYSHFKNTIH